MRALPLITLLTVAGCTGGGGGGTGGPPCTGAAPVEKNPKFALTGEALALGFSVFDSCSEPSSIDFSVYDPNNDVVASATVEQQGRLATVRFTPALGGVFHVTVRFKPNLGIAQADVRISSAHAGSPTAIIDSPPSCIGTEWEVTASGLLICLSEGKVFAAAGTTPVLLQQLPSRVESAGNVVWTKAPFLRWVEGTGPDGGRGFSPDVDAGLSLNADHILFASVNDVVDVNRQTGGVKRVSVTVGGALSRGYGMPFPLQEVPMLWRVGDTVFSPQYALNLETGEVATGGRTNARAGVDREGLWLSAADGANQSLKLIGPQLNELGVIDLTALQASLSGRPGPTSRTAPIIELEGQEFVPTLVAGTVDYELWGPHVVTATATTVITTPSVSGFTAWTFYRR